MRLNKLNDSIQQRIAACQINQSVNQSISQSINQSINQSISQSINQSINLFGDREQL